MNQRLRQRRRRQEEAGFTLLEAALALLIMMIVGLAVTSLFAHSVSYNSGAHQRAMAAALAQRRLEQLRGLAFADASLNAGTTTATETVANRDYSVTTTVTADTATLKTIRVSVVAAANTESWQLQPVVMVTRRSSTATGLYIL